MSCPFGGEVATSTVNRPVSSRSCFRTGVVPFQSWPFWPSTINALYGGAATATTANMAQSPSEVIQCLQNIASVLHQEYQQIENNHCCVPLYLRPRRLQVCSSNRVHDAHGTTRGSRSGVRMAS